MLPASLSAKWLPRDLVEATQIGGALTLTAYGLMLLVFAFEMRSYTFRTPVSSLSLVDGGQRDHMMIQLDIDMSGIDCRNLNVLVMDHSRNEPVRSMQRDLRFSSLVHREGFQLMHKRVSSEGGAGENITEEEEHQQIAERLRTQDGEAELDADWSTSHDGFKHQSFEHVIQFHEFTLVNFFASWCSHCQRFAPMWQTIANELKSKTFEDRDDIHRHVAPIKVNCVDFQEICLQQGVGAFPTIRLYKSDGTMSELSGARTMDAVFAWIELVVKTKSYGWFDKGRKMADGCNVRGHMTVPRVPGYLAVMVGGGDQNLLPEMTNATHRVNHLSFRDPASTGGWRLWAALPEEILSLAQPLDGRRFVAETAHEVYEHHLRLVTALTHAGASYQFVHFGRRADVRKDTIPQVKFDFEIEPFAIQVEYEQKRWYDLITSMLSALGGIFVLTRLLSRALVAGSHVLRGRPSGANGLLT